MKCLVAVESMESATASISMLRKLAPKQMELELLHVADASHVAPGYGFVTGIDVPSKIIEMMQRHGELLTSEAQKSAQLAGFGATSKFEWGPTSGTILSEAKRIDCDLIALHRSEKSGLERLFLGSASRAVAIGARRSALITKGQIKEGGGISAVLAYDHSPYGKRCINLLNDFQFQGISKLYLVTALDSAHSSDTLLGGDKELIESLTRASEELCASFRQQGIDCSAAVEQGPPTDVLHSAMRATKADLMIVGAQGHGFIERLLLGSVSLHQVAAESYSVLLLRA